MPEALEFLLTVHVTRPGGYLTPAEEGSCFVRLGIDVPDSKGSDSEEQLQALPLMLTVARATLEELLRTFLAAKMVLRVEHAYPHKLSDRPAEWPRTCRTPQDVRACLDTLSDYTDLPDHSLLYPILCWATPQDKEATAGGLIDGFHLKPGSKDLWRSIMNAGMVMTTITEDTCSVAVHCDRIDDAVNWARSALRGSPIPVEWYS